MGVTYFKRYRMQIRLRPELFQPPILPAGYRLVPWNRDLLYLHADTKYRSFCSEIDAHVFPCLGDQAGCHRLMEEIAEKHGFLPGATWLAVRSTDADEPVISCGTVQGIADDRLHGGIQNLGVTPEHRGLGLGRALLLRALEGFWRAGLQWGSLEVTAQNAMAVSLYRKLGFRRVKTVYKAVEVAYS
jgi:ribosomal protein S18 acetylase RimI-like enzyme